MARLYRGGLECGQCSCERSRNSRNVARHFMCPALEFCDLLLVCVVCVCPILRSEFHSKFMPPALAWRWRGRYTYYGEGRPPFPRIQCVILSGVTSLCEWVACCRGLPAWHTPQLCAGIALSKGSSHEQMFEVSCVRILVRCRWRWTLGFSRLLRAFSRCRSVALCAWHVSCIG